jgi:hypothetical protein
VSNAQTISNGPYYATPSWDQKLQCDTQATCPRFIVLSNWNNEAVLDRETGLVWERSPGILPGTSTLAVTWDPARACVGKNVGGRKAWRLPSVQELASLVDPSVGFPGPSLPAGHPFMNVQQGFYWSATTLANSPAVADSSLFAWAIDFTDGGLSVLAKTTSRFVWCVRAGGALDSY